MTTITEENFKNKEIYIELAQGQMEKWRNGLVKLEDEIKKYPSEVQAAYRREVGTLYPKWEHVQTVFGEMSEAGSEQWEEARYQWGKTAAEYWQKFMTITERIQDKYHVPLGWVQGLTDKRMHQSAGWAEGFGDRPEGSEGWAEGMGKQGSTSQGWGEGYDRRN